MGAMIAIGIAVTVVIITTTIVPIFTKNKNDTNQTNSTTSEIPLNSTIIN